MARYDFTLTVQYNANNGSGAPSTDTEVYTSTSLPYTASMTLSSSTPSRTGYTFLGWSASSSATSASYSAGGSYSYTFQNSGSHTTTLYAVWRLRTYTVSYNKGANGTGSNTSDTKTYNQTLTLKGAIFSRTGYTQVGWATSDGGLKAYNLGGSYTSNAAITLYPVWEINTYTVSYKKGSNGTGSNTSDTKTYGVALTLKGAIFTRQNYTQNGWSTTDGGTKVYNLGGSYTSNANATLYPTWQINQYTVSYKKGSNGTGTNSSETVDWNVYVVLKNAEFTRTNYTQTGWSTTDGGSKAYNLGATYTDGTSITLYPYWTQNRYVITYNSNGGSTVSNTTSGYYNGEAGSQYQVTLTSATPTRTGYNFLGWSENSSATSATYSAGGKYGFTIPSSGGTLSFTLYAVWKKQTYTVSYKKGPYGSGTESTATKTYGVTLTLKTAQFTRAGYTQVGWVNADDNTQTYSLGGNYTANAAVTLNPVWQAVLSTLSASNGTLNTQQTLTITRSSSSFTHDITYKYGSHEGSIVTGTSSTSINWTPPLSLSSQFPSATSGSCTLYLKTYNGSTLLGTTTKSITLSIPSSVKVTVSSITATEAVSGIANKIGAFVQGKSKMYVTTNISTANAYGATRTSTVVTLTGNSSTQTLNGSPVTSGIIQSSGTVTVSSSIADTRGRTSTNTGTATVLAYSPASGSIKSLERGTGGTSIIVSYKWAITALNNRNDKTIYIKHRVNGTSNWTTAATITPTAYSSETTYTISNISASSAYDIELDVKDYFGTSSVVRKCASVGNRFFDCSATDKTIAIHGDNPNNSDGFDKWYEYPVQFHKGFDVIPCRATAELSSTHWYRVLQLYTNNGNLSLGSLGVNLDFTIVRHGRSNISETHKISMLSYYGSIVFDNELSRSGVKIIDKIRYTYTTEYIYVDIHYTGTEINPVTVYWNAYTGINTFRISQIETRNLASVDDAPSGETVSTVYSFLENGAKFRSINTSNGGVGEIKSVTSAANYSISSGADDNSLELTIGAGNWIVYGFAQYSSNSTGMRRIVLSSSTSSSGALGYGSISSNRPDTNGICRLNCTYIVNRTSDLTIHLLTYQNSGSSLTVNCGIQAIRIS